MNYLSLNQKIMNLNIVTAASNSVGNAILQKIANQNDVTLWLSRKGCNISNVFNIQITDLTNRETTQQELYKILNQIDISKIDVIKLFHNCCYAVAEIPNLDKNHPLSSNPKLNIQDIDWDSIDDRSYHSLLTTFRNIFGVLMLKYSNKKISIGAICSLIDKKSYVPTIFSSMVKSNRILREEIQSLVIKNINIQSICISASTVMTQTENEFRKYCTEKKYWTSGNVVADVLVSEMKEHKNIYKDVDVYTFNPRYNEYYKNETDEQMIERLKQEIGLI